MEALLIRDLGRAPYDDVLALQHRLVAQRQAGDAHDTLLFVEHPKVITLGRSRASSGHIIAAGDTPVIQVERGGDVTWHGPGQLVGYPILRLHEHERDAHAVLRKLEDALIVVLTAYGLAAARKAGYTGVWVGANKLVSLGVAIAGWVTFHGFALNVDCDLTEFARIQPCGLEAQVMGSLASCGVQVQRPQIMADVAAAIGHAFARAPLDPSEGLR